MLKQFILLLIVSAAIILAMPYAHQAIDLLIQGHDWIEEMLTNVFAGGQTGVILRGIIALLIIPLAIAIIPGLIYWLLRRRMFPYFMEIVWVIWLLQVGALAMIYKSPVINVIS